MRSLRLPLATVLLPIALVLGWIMFGQGQAHHGAEPVPFLAFSDSGRPLTLDEVARLPEESWTTTYPRHPLIGPEHYSLWVRLWLDNDTNALTSGILLNDYRFVDRVDLWIPQPGGWRQLTSGSTLLADDKALPNRDIAFTVDLPPRSHQRLYLHYQNSCSNVPQPVWWTSSRDYTAVRTRSLLAEGAYFGITLALLVYNLFLRQRLRFLGLGWYVVYAGASGSFLLLVRQVPQELGLPLRSLDLVVLLTVLAALELFALIRFSRYFLELARVAPTADRIARGLGWAQGIVLLSAVVTPWVHQALALGLAGASICLTHIILLLIALVANRSGAAQARYFTLSFGCLFAGCLISTVTWWLDRANDGSMFGAMFGSALEMLLLSLAVADRFEHVQRATVMAQEKLAAEADHRRLIEETYADELEIEVKERTRDLSQANTDKDRMLSVIGHDLRSPLIALMRASDATGGDFAREAARTGRTLLLLIEDLVLWARLRAGTHVLAVHPARLVLTPAVALHRAFAEQGGMQLLVEADDDLLVETDLVLTQTLVRNLLANALKFALTRVVLRAEAENGKVRFSIINDGPALSPEVAARIAADESGPLTASDGLGLRLCREICGVLGHKLQARSDPKLGTEFSFAVPAASVLSPLSP